MVCPHENGNKLVTVPYIFENGFRENAPKTFSWRWGLRLINLFIPPQLIFSLRDWPKGVTWRQNIFRILLLHSAMECLQNISNAKIRIFMCEVCWHFWKASERWKMKKEKNKNKACGGIKLARFLLPICWFYMALEKVLFEEKKHRGENMKEILLLIFYSCS